mgnify:CR=1 FL=1
MFFEKGLAYLHSFAQNIWLTMLRVYLTVGFAGLITILLAYWASKSRKVGYASCLAGELLSSIPAIVWWPLLFPLALKAPWFVMFFVYLQGTLWYVYFNVMIFGMQYLRRELLELADVYNIRGLVYFKSIFLPSILPSLATGLISASGGAWNASIAAEYIAIGSLTINMGGIGSLINQLASNGDAIGVLWMALYMSLLIVIVNKSIWSRLLRKVKSRYVE